MKPETRKQWRIGKSVPINVYDGDRPVCQCHTVEDAKRIVDAVNGRADAGRDSSPQKTDFYKYDDGARQIAQPASPSQEWISETAAEISGVVLGKLKVAGFNQRVQTMFKREVAAIIAAHAPAPPTQTVGYHFDGEKVNKCTVAADQGTCDTTDWPHLRSDGTGLKRLHQKRDSCTNWKVDAPAEKGAEK